MWHPYYDDDDDDDDTLGAYEDDQLFGDSGSDSDVDRLPDLTNQVLADLMDEAARASEAFHPGMAGLRRKFEWTHAAVFDFNPFEKQMVAEFDEAFENYYHLVLRGGADREGARLDPPIQFSGRPHLCLLLCDYLRACAILATAHCRRYHNDVTTWARQADQVHLFTWRAAFVSISPTTCVPVPPAHRALIPLHHWLALLSWSIHDAEFWLETYRDPNDNRYYAPPLHRCFPAWRVTEQPDHPASRELRPATPRRYDVPYPQAINILRCFWADVKRRNPVEPAPVRRRSRDVTDSPQPHVAQPAPTDDGPAAPDEAAAPEDVDPPGPRRARRAPRARKAKRTAPPDDTPDS